LLDCPKQIILPDSGGLQPPPAHTPMHRPSPPGARCCGWFAGRRTGVVVAFARWRWCCWWSVETRSTVAQVVRLHASRQLAATYLRHCRGAGDRQTSTGRSRCHVPSTVSVGHSQQQPRAVGALTTRTIVCCNIIHYSVAVKKRKEMPYPHEESMRGAYLPVRPWARSCINH